MQQGFQPQLCFHDIAVELSRNCGQCFSCTGSNRRMALCSSHACWRPVACFALHLPAKWCDPDLGNHCPRSRESCEGTRRHIVRVDSVAESTQCMGAVATRRMGSGCLWMEALQRSVSPTGVLLHTIAILAFSPLGAQPRELSAASRRMSVRTIGHSVSLGKLAPCHRKWGFVAYRSCAATSSRLVLWGGGGGGDRGETEESSVCAQCFIVMRLFASLRLERVSCFSVETCSISDIRHALISFHLRYFLGSLGFFFEIVAGHRHRRHRQDWRRRTSQCRGGEGTR